MQNCVCDFNNNLRCFSHQRKIPITNKLGSTLGFYSSVTSRGLSHAPSVVDDKVLATTFV